jgi:hypothetical protein
MLARWWAGASTLAALAVVAMPATGQNPAPACTPDVQITPDKFAFDDNGVPTQTETVGHSAEVFVSVPDSGPWVVSGTQITGPPGLALSTMGDSSHETAGFTPTAAGALAFTATWTQYKEPSGPACTGSASASLTATAPTPARAMRVLGFRIRHRAGNAGSFNEFVLRAIVTSDAKRGDRSPITFVVRAAKGARRPPAATPALTVTLDPNKIPSNGVSASNRLLRIQAGRFADSTTDYEFDAGVVARPPNARGRAGRGVEMTLRQSSRTIGTYHYVTTCDSVFGGLECIPLPKGTPAP